jgi:translation initiation factor 3 subunit M
MWAIEAITSKIIDAKIDQLNGEIVIKSHQLKQIKEQEWLSIQAKIKLWREKFERMHEVLSASTEIVSQQ